MGKDPRKEVPGRDFELVEARFGSEEGEKSGERDLKRDPGLKEGCFRGEDWIN